MRRATHSALPTRTCVGCGQRDAQPAMLRLHRDDAGAIAEARRGAAGRSAYVHVRPDCVGGLLRSKGLGRSLRLAITKETRSALVEALQKHLASAGATGMTLTRSEEAPA